MNGTGSPSSNRGSSGTGGRARQTRDGVIPQDNRSVKPGGYRPDMQPPRLRRDLGRPCDGISLEAMNRSDQQYAIVVENLDQIGIGLAESTGTRAPTKNRAGTVEP